MVSAIIGRKVVADVSAPSPDDIDVPFMFWRLRQLRRFSGNGAALTVDQHHHLCGVLADRAGMSRAVRRWARLHDAHEYALGDVIRPLRAVLGSDGLNDLAARWDVAIATRLRAELPDEVEALQVALVDDWALAIEWAVIFGREPDELGVTLPPDTTRPEAEDLLRAALAQMRVDLDQQRAVFSSSVPAYDAAAYAVEARMRKSGVL